MNEKQEYPLIRSDDRELAQLNAGISLASKLLQISSDERFIEYFMENPELVIRLISRFYPLGTEMIERYKDRWDWECLSENKSLSWSLELIEKFKDRWEWGCLSENKSLPWNAKLIENYDSRWSWKELSNNKSLPWSIELIEKYKDKLGWSSLCYNTSLPWSLELIEKYKDRWECLWLSENESIHWNAELIEKFKDKWYWFSLSINSSLPWSLELIEKFKDRWDWGRLSENESIHWNAELIEKFKDKWDWFNFQGNSSLPWSLELIEKFKDKWDWEMMSWNSLLPWSLELFEKYKDKWKWEMMSRNESLTWSIELIEKYKDKWSWCNLSFNKSLPWSLELIEKYEDKWSWCNLSFNESLPWSLELIEKYEDKWNWYNLSGNPSLPWSISFIDKYESRWTNIRTAGNDYLNSCKWLRDEEIADYYGFWFRLSQNKGMPWDVELKQRYEKKWNWDMAELKIPIELLDKIFNNQKFINNRLIEKSMEKKNYSRDETEPIESYRYGGELIVDTNYGISVFIDFLIICKECPEFRQSVNIANFIWIPLCFPSFSIEIPYCFEVHDIIDRGNETYLRNILLSPSDKYEYELLSVIIAVHRYGLSEYIKSINIEEDSQTADHLLIEIDNSIKSGTPLDVILSYICRVPFSASNCPLDPCRGWKDIQELDSESYSEACYNLGKFYNNGFRSIFWFRKAVERGYSQGAERELADAYTKFGNSRKAAYWRNKATKSKDEQ